MSHTEQTQATTYVRVLAPDLARGLMLLFIALVHSQALAYDPAGGGAGDQAGRAVLTLFVDGRAYPMFAFLFGYGMVQLARRTDDPDRVLRRRSWYLVLFGFAHVALLYQGDILAAYGILGLLFARARAWRDRRIWWFAGIAALAGAALYGGLFGLGGNDAAADGGGLGPFSSAAIRVAGFFFVTPMNVVMAAAPLLVGIWAARRRIVEEPLDHEPLLRRTAVFGLVIAVVGGIPWLGQLLDWWQGAGFSFAALHTLTGLGGGLAYVAIIALVSTRLDRDGVVVRALAATGRRSLSAYLFQSAVWFFLIEAYLLDLTGALGVLVAAAIGAATWLTSVLLADQLGRHDLKGPAERLLRHLAYRPARPKRR